MKNRTELIEKYIDNELNSDERKYVEQLIADDEDFAKEFQLRLNINHAIMENDIVLLRKNLEEICRNSTQDKGAIIRRLYKRKWHLVAASATILVVIGSFLLSDINTNSTESLFQNNYTFEVCIEVERGNSSTIDKNIKTALLHYNNSEFKEAIAILKDNQKDIISKFYLGLSYIETKKYNKAIICFQDVLDDNSNLFLEQSKWYKGLCYLKLDKKKEAKNIFQEIVKNDDLFKNQASKILDSL
jgi:tetratricopeptide (TPR) repeat protein